MVTYLCTKDYFVPRIDWRQTVWKSRDNVDTSVLARYFIHVERSTYANVEMDENIDLSEMSVGPSIDIPANKIKHTTFLV